MSHGCQRFWNCYKTLTSCSLLARCRTRCTCHNDGSTSKNGPTCGVFIVLLPFWLRNVLRAPAPCTLNFQQLNFQKCSEPDCFSQFWLRNVLRATTACTFSTARLQNGLQFFISHLPRWLRTRRFSQPIFRPSGARRHWKNTGSRGFSTFSHTCIFFPLTLSLLVLFLLLFSSLLFSSPLVSSLLFSFPSLPFPSLLFSDSSHLCFSICAHCRKFDF